MELELIKKELKPTFGDLKFIVEYSVSDESTQNKYTIKCELLGLDNAKPELSIISVIAHTNNENTLIAYALADELDMQIGYDVKTEFEK